MTAQVIVNKNDGFNHITSITIQQKASGDVAVVEIPASSMRFGSGLVTVQTVLGDATNIIIGTSLEDLQTIKRAASGDSGVSPKFYTQKTTTAAVDWLQLYAPLTGIQVTFTGGAKNGNILTFAAPTGGSGYLDGTYTAVPLTNVSGTAGYGATATIAVTGGVINTVGTITPGSGYVEGVYTAVPLTVSSGTAGTAATADITIGTGVIATIGSIATGGNNYVNGTYSNVNLSVASGTVGGGATANVTVTGGLINSFDNLIGGSGYIDGVYTAVPLVVTSGTIGSSATADITVTGGIINAIGTVTVGSLYTNGTYTGVISCLQFDAEEPFDRIRNPFRKV